MVPSLNVTEQVDVSSGKIEKGPHVVGTTGAAEEGRVGRGVSKVLCHGCAIESNSTHPSLS